MVKFTPSKDLSNALKSFTENLISGVRVYYDVSKDENPDNRFVPLDLIIEKGDPRLAISTAEDGIVAINLILECDGTEFPIMSKFNLIDVMGKYEGITPLSINLEGEGEDGTPLLNGEVVPTRYFYEIGDTSTLDANFMFN